MQGAVGCPLAQCMKPELVEKGPKSVANLPTVICMFNLFLVYSKLAVGTLVYRHCIVCLAQVMYVYGCTNKYLSI